MNIDLSNTSHCRRFIYLAESYNQRGHLITGKLTIPEDDYSILCLTKVSLLNQTLDP